MVRGREEVSGGEHFEVNDEKEESSDDQNDNGPTNVKDEISLVMVFVTKVTHHALPSFAYIF